MTPSVTALAHRAFPDLGADRPYHQPARRQPPVTQSGLGGVDGFVEAPRRNPDKLVKLTHLVATINTWNKVAISFRSVHAVKPAQKTA
jgi:hypothetical protein